MDRKKHKHEDPPAEQAPDTATPAAEAAAAAPAGQAPDQPAAEPAAAQPKPGNEAQAAHTARIAELEGRLLRLMADFDNFRKRTAREKDELYSRANENLMLQLLPVIDHLSLAIDAAKAHNAAVVFVEGFNLVAQQLSETLAKFGLKPVNTAGTAFNPAVHEAISHMPSADVPEDGIIVETRRGYMLGEKLLRASQVVVSSGPPEPAGNTDG